jgi:uncharacterized protein YggU (UPF0235/DUF167 family)
MENEQLQKQLEQQMQLDKQAIKIRCMELASDKTIEIPVPQNGKYNYSASRDLTAEEMTAYAQKLYDFITS